MDIDRFAFAFTTLFFIYCTEHAKTAILLAKAEDTLNNCNSYDELAGFCNVTP